jgi:hypothetical protein
VEKDNVAAIFGLRGFVVSQTGRSMEYACLTARETKANIAGRDKTEKWDLRG